MIIERTPQAAVAPFYCAECKELKATITVTLGIGPSGGFRPIHLCNACRDLLIVGLARQARAALREPVTTTAKGVN